MAGSNALTQALKQAEESAATNDRQNKISCLIQPDLDIDLATVTA